MTALSPHQDLKKLTYSECPFSPKIEKVVHKNYESCFYTGWLCRYGEGGWGTVRLNEHKWSLMNYSETKLYSQFIRNTTSPEYLWTEFNTSEQHVLYTKVSPCYAERIQTERWTAPSHSQIQHHMENSKTHGFSSETYVHISRSHIPTKHYLMGPVFIGREVSIFWWSGKYFLVFTVNIHFMSFVAEDH